MTKATSLAVLITIDSVLILYGLVIVRQVHREVLTAVLASAYFLEFWGL